MADAVVEGDRPQRLAGGVPCQDRCLVLGADFGGRGHAFSLPVKVARLGGEGCQARRASGLAPVSTPTWQPSPGPATIDRREARATRPGKADRLDNALGTHRQAAEPSETTKPPRRPASGANHLSETRKKCLRKPFSCPHRCLYKQHQETFTSVDDRYHRLPRPRDARHRDRTRPPPSPSHRHRAHRDQGGRYRRSDVTVTPGPPSRNSTAYGTSSCPAMPYETPLGADGFVDCMGASRGQGLSASRENEPSRGDPLSHPDASPQWRSAWMPSGGRLLASKTCFFWESLQSPRSGDPSIRFGHLALPLQSGRQA